MLAAELVKMPEDGPDPFEGLKRLERRRRPRLAWTAEQSEPFFGQREEDVVLAREVAVDRGRTVFDTLRDLTDGDVLVSLGHEELACGIENGSPDRLAVAFLSFFDSHVSGRGEQCLID